MATKNLNVSEADFFLIKENIKNYLRNQNQFTDYDFEGSSMSVLLDIMAYSVHYTAMHTNMAFGETFLDSAVQRGSVVSRAKELGYTPRSMSAAKAIIRVAFSVAGNPNEYILPKGTRFSTSAGGETYSFVTTRDYIIENDGNGVFSEYIDIYQGKFTTSSYVVNLNDASQRLIVANKNADTRFLSVLYKDTLSSTTVVPYENINNVDISNLNGETNVYFLQETYDGFFETYFGDGVIGKQLQNGNVVQLNYLLTDGAAANGSRVFTLGSALTNVSAVNITTQETASGGSDRESVESIKYLAPFYYQTQKRAVTEDDYKALIGNTYPDVDDISIWGGEKNTPPFYGKVFIAIKPKASTYFSNAIKASIQNDIISRFNIVSIRPEIVDADYIDVSVKTVVTYNARLYDRSSNINLEQQILNSINTFFSTEANKFGRPLYYSKLVSAIDDTNSLILNSVTNLTLEKFKEIYPGIAGTYNYVFNNSLHPGSIVSNEFVVDGLVWKMKDIPNSAGPHTTGNLAVYRVTNQGQTIYLTRNAGTVDYNSGNISVNNFRIDSIVDNTVFRRLIISVSPGSFIDTANPAVVYTDYNVYTNERDQIIRLKSNGVSLTLIPDES